MCAAREPPQHKVHRRGWRSPSFGTFLSANSLCFCPSTGNLFSVPSSYFTLKLVVEIHTHTVESVPVHLTWNNDGATGEGRTKIHLDRLIAWLPSPERFPSSTDVVSLRIRKYSVKFCGAYFMISSVALLWTKVKLDVGEWNEERRLFSFFSAFFFFFPDFYLLKFRRKKTPRPQPM